MQFLNFLSCLQSQLHYFDEKYGCVVFKPNQMVALEALFTGKDTLAILPTGYGKSMIYQIGMKLIASVRQVTDPICIVVSPLNSLIDDQASVLTGLGFNVGLIALNDRKPGYEVRNSERSDSDEDGDDEDDDELTVPEATPEISNNDMIQSGKLDFLFTHPEALLSRSLGKPLLRKVEYQRRTVLIVVDEAHCVVEWGPRFRRDYGRLGALSALLKNPVRLAMTATAPPAYRTILMDSLCLREPKVVCASPDRPNIKYEIVYMSDSGTSRYDKILTPIATGLKEKRLDYPQTVIYGALKYCGYAYAMFERILGDEQYEPPGQGSGCNRIFCQFHGAYPISMNSISLKSVVRDRICRVVFASPSFGMGIDAPEIRTIIHIGVPRSVEEYFQETGRAGRDGSQSRAVLYYNGQDISTNRSDLREGIRQLCKLDSCVRGFLLEHFGFDKTDIKKRIPHSCCSNCATSCDCEKCSPPDE